MMTSRPRRLRLKGAAVLAAALGTAAPPAWGQVVVRPGIDREAQDVMRGLRAVLGCIPEKKGANFCITSVSGLEVVFVKTRPGTPVVYSVETLVRTGGTNVREIRRAMPSVTRLVSFLFPDGNRAATLARAAVARTKTTTCVQMLRYGRYEMEIEHVMPFDVEGVFANLILRKLPAAPSARGRPKARAEKWEISEKCDPWA